MKDFESFNEEFRVGVVYWWEKIWFTEQKVTWLEFNPYIVGK